MNALVTGATGLIGGNLARALAAAGHRVRALVRPQSNTAALDGQGVELVRGDVTDRAALLAAARDCDLIFHAAAQVAMWVPDPERMRRVNVEGTGHVLDAAEAAKVKRVVHVSSVDAIGFGTPEGWGGREKPSHEGVPFNNEGLGIPYLSTKHAAQELVLTRVAAGRVDAVVVNPAYVFGPWDVKPSSGKMILAVAAGRGRWYPPGGNNFIGVDDVVAGIIAAAERGRPGELYILGHENLSYREVFAKIAAVTGGPPPRRALPRALIHAGGLAGSLWGALFGWAGARPETVNRTTARLGCRDHYFDPAKAVRELGLPQTPIDRAIESAWRWFRDHGYVKSSPPPATTGA